MLLGLLACALVSPAPFNFYGFGPYDLAVPTPDVVLGYGPGERETTYYGQEETVKAIVGQAKDRAVYIRYGTSTEGRPLRILVISSPKNMRRLEEIRLHSGALASGAPANPEAIFRNDPAIVWVNECIHGDEPASFEDAMWLLYNLAASKSKRITDLLDKCVVILNPSYNPDGHERFVVWYNSVESGNASPEAVEQHEPRGIYGRLNHYRFDMNRDRIAMSQQETKKEVAEYLRWNPQVYVDQHGQVSTYFFPPASLSVNINVDRARYNKWAELFGHAAGDAFDTQGFPYYVKDVFDLYYPGYLDSWTTLNGAIGMTNETDGGFSIQSTRADGSMATLRGSMARHFTAVLAYVRTAAQHREELLRDFAAYRAEGLRKTAIGPYHYLTVHSSDPGDIQNLWEQLGAEGIESWGIEGSMKIKDAHSLWGSHDGDVALEENELVIPLDQPQGHLVKALFDTAPDFEPEFIKEQLRRRAETDGGETYPEPDAAEFYDLTAWNPALAQNLDAWFSVSMDKLNYRSPNPPDWSVPPGKVGYLIPPSVQGSLAVADLLDKGVHIDVATKPLGGTTYPAGTFIVFRDRNAANLDHMVRVEAAKHLMEYRSLDSSYPIEGREGAGSESVRAVAKPRIGVFFGDISSPTSFSGTWFLLEKTFGLPFTALRTSALNEDLSSFSCLIFPEGQYQPGDKLRDWLNAGGCAIVLGAQNWAVSGYAHLEAARGEKEPATLPGSLFRATINPRSFLSFGYSAHPGSKDIEIAVPVAGNSYYKARSEGGGAVVMSDQPNFKKLLAGWEWPNDTEQALEGTVWVHDQPVGRGHLIIFMSDPTDRAMWSGFNKMLLNAILLGASSER